MGKSVLVVDDSKSIREMVCYVLESNGYQVDEAENGQIALDSAKKKSYQLILTDQNMPVMNGLNLVRNLRVMPAYQKIPVLVITTESSNEMKQEGKAAGATGWIVKPFNPETLIAVVKKVLP